MEMRSASGPDSFAFEVKAEEHLLNRGLGGPQKTSGLCGKPKIESQTNGPSAGSLAAHPAVWVLLREWRDGSVEK